jgi:alpha-glucosidase
MIMESYMNVGANQVAVQEFPDNVQSWSREGNRFYFYTTEVALEVDVK